MEAPRTFRQRMAAEQELRSATIEFTRVHHTMIRAPPADAERLKREAVKAEARLRAAEAIVEKLARKGADAPGA